jgi:hypothetical protein
MNRWADARPELIIAAVAVAIAAVAAVAVAGWPGLVTVAVATVVLAVATLRGLIPRSAAIGFRKAKDKPRAQPLSGYGHRVFVVGSSLSSREMYESDLRMALEHVLAARLAENHGINLYTEPAAAKRAFTATRADESLWYWIDPRQALNADNQARAVNRARESASISSRTLARLITRLEQL